MKLLFALFLSLTIFCTKSYSQNIILQNEREAKFFTDLLSREMKELATAYFEHDSKACDLYNKFHHKLSTTIVEGSYFNSARLTFRINWYKNPEVNLFEICTKPKTYTANIYDFLILHSNSLAGWIYFDKSYPKIHTF